MHSLCTKKLSTAIAAIERGIAASWLSGCHWHDATAARNILPKEAYRALVVALLVSITDAGVARGKSTHFNQLLDLTLSVRRCSCDEGGGM